MTTAIKQSLTQIFEDFGDEFLTMNKHDRNALMVALAAQQYFCDAYPAERVYDLADCVGGLIPEGEDMTTNAIEGILKRFSDATQPERLALIQVLAETIGGG